MSTDDADANEESKARSSEEMWVVVETHKGVGEMFSYRGRTTRKAFDAWTSGHLMGALPLADAYWMEQRGGSFVPYVVGRRGDYKNATGTIHVHSDTIVVIMELDGPDPGVTDGDSTATVLSLAPGTGRRSGGPRVVRDPVPPATKDPVDEDSTLHPTDDDE